MSMLDDGDARCLADPPESVDAARKEATARPGAALSERLFRLRAQAGSPAPPLRSAPPAPSRGRASTRYDDRERLRSLLARRPGAAVALPSRVAGNTDRQLPGSLIAPGLRYVEHWIPCPTPAPFQPTWCEADAVPADRLLCFDTETTGLAGGSGTRAFMIGASDWRDGGLRRRQLYIESTSAERAMLLEFARWLARDQVLVSYNGRCYDAPLLTTRYRLARLPNPIAERLHLDLLTPVRRRFRGIWENCRLLTAERELLGVVRHDDLPGAQAPAAWLEYLRGGSAERLRRVLQHNAQDVESLAGLVLALPQVAARAA
jgi:uncharacterized protein